MAAFVPVPLTPASAKSGAPGSDTPRPVTVVKHLPPFTAQTLCRVLQTHALAADTIAANRHAIRARVFDRFPRLAALYHRADDEARVDFASDSDSDSDRDEYASPASRVAARVAARAAQPEITVDVVAALLRIYDNLVFGGGLAAVFHARRWRLEVAMGDWPTDGVRLLKCEDGGSYRAPPPAPRYSGVLVEVSARTPSAYCFDAAPVTIFGRPCADALDCLLLQVEHQVVHAALLVGGCADADVHTARALLRARDDPEAAAVRVKLDALPHGGAMARVVRALFGHVTPAHGPHVWAVPAHAPDDPRACCAYDAIPRTQRAVEAPPARPSSLWTRRTLLRAASAAAATATGTAAATRGRGDAPPPLELIVFDPAAARWRGGMQVLRVGRWYAEVAPASGSTSGSASGCRTLQLPLPFVAPVLPDTRPDSRRRIGGFWGTLGYGAVVLRLPPPADDLERYGGSEEAETAYRLSRKDAAAYADAFVTGLERAEFRGAADTYGANVLLRTADGKEVTVPATAIMPESFIVYDARAPSTWEA